MVDFQFKGERRLVFVAEVIVDSSGQKKLLTFLAKSTVWSRTIFR